MDDSAPEPTRLPDWEAFYRDYRKPGYVPGFEITSKLGGGSFGLVFRARKESIGKDYAIKFLKVEDGEVRQAVMRELDQVRFFAEIDHPNLVQIEDRGEVDGIPYLVMQYAGSETLRDRLPGEARAPTDAERAELMTVFLQACRGVAALHEHSLVHFDLKPANVFLRGSVARVGDYGLSKLVTHSRASLSMGRGTPYYMAPEILQRRGDHRSDIYALGVMLYEILCGVVPFTGDSEWEVLRRHEKQPPNYPEHLSSRDRAVLDRCLEKNPEARYESVEDLIAALGAPARATAPSAPPPLLPRPRAEPPPLPSERARRPSRRRGRLPPLAKAAIALGIASIVFSTMVVGPLGPDRSYPGRSRSEAVASPGPSRASEGEAEAVVTSVDSLVQSVEWRVRRLEEMGYDIELRDLHLSDPALRADLEACREEVERLADSPVYSAGHAAKVGLLGRPAFLAAASLLQRCDYADLADCRRAANASALLAQMTGLESLRIDPPLRTPGLRDRLHMRALADAWRQLAERLAVDDVSYAALVEAGRSRGR